MPPLRYSQPPPVVYHPSRADQRIVRSILANVRDGEPSAGLDRIAGGSPALAVRFLAACRGLSLVAVVHGLDGAACSFCRPDGQSAVDLCQRALELPPPHARPSCFNPGRQYDAGHEGRAVVLRDAVERLVAALNDRGDCAFALAWRVDGDVAVELDYSHQLGREVAIDWITWFLNERLQAATLPTEHTATYQGS
jgi:hypothetical protein